MAAIGKLGGEALVEELIATHGDPRLLAGALVANGLLEIYERLHPDGPALSVPARERHVPANVFGTSVGGLRGPPITLRSRAKQGEPSQEAQAAAEERLGQAAAAASRGEEVKETLTDIPLDEPVPERVPRPIRTGPSMGGIKKAAAAVGATTATGATYQAARGAGGTTPGTGAAPITPTQPTTPSTPATPTTTIGATPATPAGPAWTQSGTPIGSTPAIEGMRQAAQIPGRSSPYASGVAGTWIMPKRGAYTRELWYKVAAGNASRMLSG